MSKFFRSLVLILVGLAFGTPVLAQEISPVALQREDIRLALVAERIMIANADLCTRLMPVTGMVLHSADQYPSASAQSRFANGPLAVAAILPNSPAASAGVAPDDAILAINGQQTAVLEANEGHLREAGFGLLANQPTDEALRLLMRRAGSDQEIFVQASSGCRTLVEIRLGDGPRAISNGEIIQIRFDFAQSITDEELAVVFAHELAHSVLEHRRRKEEAGIQIGVLGELGRNQRANREAEVEADRLSIHLLANAGYDPTSAARFWRFGSGVGLGGGFLGTGIYPSNDARADIIANEIELYLPLGRGPSWPGHLLVMRERSFSTD